MTRAFRIHHGAIASTNPAINAPPKARWRARGLPNTTPKPMAKGTNKSQPGRINVANPAAIPESKASPPARAPRGVSQAAIHRPKLRSIHEQNGASLNTVAPTAMDPGYTAAIAAASSPAAVPKSLDPIHATPATESVSSPALNAQPQSGDASSPAKQKIGASSKG